MNRKKPEFEWPEYKTEKERIRAYSNKFKNTTISEAFSDVYKIRLNPGYELVGNETPKELNIGDEVFARIIHVDKNITHLNIFSTIFFWFCKMFCSKHRENAASWHFLVLLVFDIVTPCFQISDDSFEICLVRTFFIKPIS